MKYFDLHCDTALRMLHEKKELLENSFHISLNRADYLDSYAQIMAIWTPQTINDADGYKRFFDIVRNLKNEVSINSEKVGLATTYAQIKDLLASNKMAMILSVEDARILENNISRLDSLYESGVRFLTLNWAGVSCIGGSHDTNEGLTDFGVRTVQRCFELGIIPDISHSSFKTASEVISLAKEYKKPIIASHSDSFTLNPHSRNLRDEDFVEIVKLSGIVGINFCPDHLSSRGEASIDDVLRHTEQFLSLGGEDTIAMGSDFDGTALPDGIEGIEHVYKIFDEMKKRNYSDELIEKIAFKNAQNFFKNNL